MQDHDRDQLVKIGQITPEAMELYKLYQHAHHKCSGGPLPYEVILLIAVQGGMVTIPQRAPSEWDDVEPGTAVKIYDGIYGYYDGEFVDVKNAPDGMVTVDPHGDPSLRRSLLMRDVKLVDGKKAKPKPEVVEDDEPKDAPPQQPELPSPWDKIEPGTPVMVAAEGTVINGTYFKPPYGRRKGKVAVTVPGDKKKFRYYAEEDVRLVPTGA